MMTHGMKNGISLTLMESLGCSDFFWQTLNECLSYLAVRYHLIVEFCSHLVDFLGCWWLWSSVCGEKGAETKRCNLKS